MRLGNTKNGHFKDEHGVPHNITEMKYKGKVIWPLYSLELSQTSIFISAGGDSSTITVYGVARNEAGEEIYRNILTYPEVDIKKTGSNYIKQSVFTFYGDNLGTTVRDEQTAVYTFTWKGKTAQLTVTQEANRYIIADIRRFFLVNGNEYETGSNVSFSSDAQTASLSCKYTNHYVYTSNAEEYETLPGAIHAVQGTGFSFANNVLTIAENTGASARTATITGRFPGPGDEYTLTAEQEKPAVVVYDVNWLSYTMQQVGGKKQFRFSITYNANLYGEVTFNAVKVNNGTKKMVATMKATLSGTSYSYTGNDFANNDSTVSGDKYYIEFSYGGQTFTSPEMDNQIYLSDPKVVYNSGHTYILADASNFAYVTVDVMQGGTVISSGVRADVKTMTADGLTIANGRVYGSDRGTDPGPEISGTIDSIQYGGVVASTTLLVKQQANAVTKTTNSYDYVLSGLATPFGGSSQAASKGATGSITYTSCKQYNTPTYTYTSGKSKTGTRAEVGSVTPSFSSSQTWATISGATLTIAKQDKSSINRNATITAVYAGVNLGSVTIYQKETVASYGVNVSSSAASVGAGGGSVSLYATGITSYDNGDAADSTSLTSGWSCTNSGSLVSGKWSVSGQTASASTLGTTTTTGNNVGTFSITWNGVTRTLTVNQAQNVKTTGTTQGSITLDGTQYSSSATLNITYSQWTGIVSGSAYRLDTYTSGAPATRVDLTSSLSVSGTGFSIVSSSLVVTENKGSSSRNGTLTLKTGSTTLITLTITQAAYVPSYWMIMTATYRQQGGRKNFTAVVDYSSDLRGEKVVFQPYRINGGTRYNLGAGSTVTLPSDSDTYIASIAVSSSTASGDTYYIEATWSGRILANEEATSSAII